MNVKDVALISRLFRRPQSILVVSGLPRSGTSMMMQMLAAGGMPILTDHIRREDAHNPRGYYEFERVKRLHMGDHGWLSDARGKAVKIISPLLAHLPPDYVYQVIFMRRDLREVLASQQIMRGENGTFNAEQLAQEYSQHLKTVINWLADQSTVELLQIDYPAAIRDPAGCAEQVNRFLGGLLDPALMQQVIDLRLYHQRS